ncbi:MAG: hypothetical protein IPK33_16445 [Gemmatimonadetes bacterium]|nr:hypothetical protein [Gemmatimonadota bacterium]
MSTARLHGTRLALSVLAVSASLPTLVAAQQGRAGTAPAAPAVTAFDTSVFQAISWRNIGPSRGGRANAIVGIP